MRESPAVCYPPSRSIIHLGRDVRAAVRATCAYGMKNPGGKVDAKNEHSEPAQRPRVLPWFSLLRGPLPNRHLQTRIRGVDREGGRQTRSTIKARNGSDMIVKMADNYAVMAFVKASMADIKPNSLYRRHGHAGGGR